MRDRQDRSETGGDTDETLTEMVEIATEPLYSVDSDGQFEMANDAFAALTGYDHAGLIGREALSLIHEEDREEWNRRRQLLARDETVESERWVGRLISKNGTEIPVEWQFRILEDERIVGRARDVREGRHKERKLSVLNRALRHNIRNQMNLIIGKAVTLQEVEDEGYRTAARKIEEIGQNIVTISDKARKAQEHIGITPDAECETDLSAVVETVVMKFSIRFPDISVETDIPPNAQARAPPSVDTALMELLENAVVHHLSGAGPATISIDREGDQICLRVIDECAPVPEPVIETLTLGSEEPLQHNQGIGLWIVRWVVDSVDGELSFDRRADDEGNIVTMTFDRLD